MNSVWRIVNLTAIGLVSVLAAAQNRPAGKNTPPQGNAPAQTRDLKYEEANTTPAPSVAVPRGYALIIGVANYKKLPAKAQLDFSERDADAVYSILISPEGGNFRAENVHRLTGAQATLANIKRELETWLPSVAKQDDRVVIYFAGHGFISGGRGYLAPSDLDPNNIPGTGYGMDTLGQVVSTRIKAKWKVLLTDACHSGVITPDADAQAIYDRVYAVYRSLYERMGRSDAGLLHELKRIYTERRAS